MRLFLIAALAVFPAMAAAQQCAPEITALKHHNTWQQEVIEQKSVQEGAETVLWQLWLNDFGWWSVTRLRNGEMCIEASGQHYSGEKLEDFVKVVLGLAL